MRVALAGNPNAGKTTLFNTLTGLRHHVGNWPGKTVEKKQGMWTYQGESIEVTDLPGTYSITPYAEDERVAKEAL
ncbi:ferrous iron transporter B, partial [Candidatus Woesearchaeota archaeon CG11_big_fil_rev_8_21_14_0_20_57_5]